MSSLHIPSSSMPSPNTLSNTRMTSNTRMERIHKFDEGSKKTSI
jgi:hypothetical protein